MVIALCCGNIFFITGNKKDTAAIRVSQQKGIDFLKRIQQSNGAIADTINPLFDIWETTLAVSAICKTGADTNTPVIKNGLAFLANNQNREGLICHNQKCKAAYCLETTAVYFNLLQLTGKNGQVKDASKKIVALQKSSGDWDIGNPDVNIEKNFPSVTAFVLNMLQTAGTAPAYKKESISWLLQKQTKEGHWGAAWEYYGCTGYALWPVLKLLQNENTRETQLAKDKAVAYIMSAQNNNGSWFYHDPAFAKQTSAELQTVLMLAALQHAGIKSNAAIVKGIDFLLHTQQKNGSWNGGYFPIPEKRYSKQEYVFATALAVEVMHTYLLNNS